MVESRDQTGRFVKGHPGNPEAKGRPKRKTEDKYLLALQKCVKLGDWKAIGKRAVAQAKTGDYRARQWLSDYLLGKPQQFVDVTSAGEKVVAVTVYLPEMDELETESGATGEVPS